MDLDDTRDGGALDRRLDAWVRADLMSDQQAAAIRQFERSQRPSIRVGASTEVAAYLGSVLALMGGAAVVAREWGAIGFAGRLAVAGALLIVGLSAGGHLAAVGEPGTDRLADFLRVIGSGGAAMAVALTVHQLGASAAAVVTWVGLALVGIGGWLWRGRDRPLQLATAAVGCALIVVAGGDLLGVPLWVRGIVAWALAVGWYATIHALHLRPRVAGQVLATVGAVLGALMLIDLDEHAGPVLAVVTAAAIVADAARGHQREVLGVGVLGFLVAVQSLLQTTLSGVGSGLVVAVLGLGVVTMAVRRGIRPRAAPGVRSGRGLSW